MLVELALAGPSLLSPANPVLSPAAAGSEQAMGPALPVHEAAVRAEGSERVMGTQSWTLPSRLGPWGIPSTLRASSLAAAALNLERSPLGPSPAPLLCLSTQITELRQKLADAQKQVTDLEAEREQKQRDFDRKLLLAKSKIEMEEASMTPGPAGSALRVLSSPSAGNLVE